jgi:membrane glycosyltransferase
LKRDRRWCRGNLINARLIGAPGVHPAHRALFLTGLMAYVTAPLWALFLALCTALVAVHALVPPSYFVEPRQLFPLWPAWNLAWAIGLLGATAVLLFVPKLLALGLVLLRNPKEYGGAARLAVSALLEIVLSALLAPVRMLFHTQFVLSALSGFAVRWKSPSREDAETSWEYAVRAHAWQSALGLAWGVGVYLLDPQFLRWLLPVAGALVLVVPVSVLTSRVSFGRRLRDAGLFVIPEETRPPAELASVSASLRLRRRYARFIDAVLDPAVNDAMQGARAVPAHERPAAAARRKGHIEHALRAGPQGLGTAARLALLADPLTLSRLHQQLKSAVAAYEAWQPTISYPRAHAPYARAVDRSRRLRAASAARGG